MQRDKDYFELYLDKYPDSPSLVIVRSVEAKNFPYEYIKEPVLDLCCGNGFFAKVIGLANAYGCDIDDRALEKAKAIGVYKELKVCDARDLRSYPDEFFNTIISNCALEHVDGIDQAIGSISRILKRNGVLIMTVPSENLNNWFPGNKDKLFKYNQRQKHINVMQLNEWRELLIRYSLHIEKYFYLFDKKQYKLCIFFDALPELLPRLIYAIYYRTLKVTPKFVKKFVFRRILKPIYNSSIPLDNGSELLMVAKKT